MFPASFHRSRAAMALEMANAATTPKQRDRFLALWREWTAAALGKDGSGKP